MTFSYVCSVLGGDWISHMINEQALGTCSHTSIVVNSGGLYVFWFHTNACTDSSWFSLFPHRSRFSGWRRPRERTWCTDRENSLKPPLSDKTHSSKDVFISIGLITLIKFLFLMLFLLSQSWSGEEPGELLPVAVLWSL